MNPWKLLTHVPLQEVRFYDRPVLLEWADPDNRLVRYRLVPSGPYYTVTPDVFQRFDTTGTATRDITRALLKKTWPTVTTWQFPG
jgi:hypothetical protein